MRVTCIAGARPNFMKIKPVMEALQRLGSDVFLVHTEQHYDEPMSALFLRDLNLPKPDHSLAAGSGSHAQQSAAVMQALEPVLEDMNPDVAVVVGDVNSTLASALVAAKQGCLVAHVEAGLRSRDWSMPEEINRVVTDRLSDYLFAPSQEAVANLRREGYREDQIHFVGNVMIDSLFQNLDRARARDIATRLGVDKGRYGLVTLHRPSTVDDRQQLDSVVAGLRLVSRECPLVFPAHPRTATALADVDTNGLLVTEPLGYLDFIALETKAAFVITDSGGIQEETTALGIPCLTVRENTERPITITEGTNRLVGSDPKQILEAAREALTEEREPRRPQLWDGNAADRIAEVIVNGGARTSRKRPTEI